MSKPSEKLKINRTRKRIYEMHQEDAPETVSPLQDPIAGIVVSTPDMVEETVEAVESAVPDTVVAELSVEQSEKQGAVESSGEPLQQDALITDEVHKPAAVKELSALEIARMEFAAETAAREAIAAEESEHSEMEEPLRSAMATVYKYSALSAATGLIPMPLVDMAGLMAMQLMMLKKLCALYDIPFDSQRSKSAIAILASGISSTCVAVSSTKLIPFIGAFSIATMPAVTGAFSYAVGRVFIRHFASGGTFLDFDADKVKGYFQEQFRAGKLNRDGNS